MKLTNKKGFTLMEMLIVVAIIAILVAIAIPTFSSSLRKAKEAADCANIRAQYAEDLVGYLDSGDFANDTDAVKDYKGHTLNYDDQLKQYELDEENGVITVYYEGQTIELELD